MTHPERGFTGFYIDISPDGRDVKVEGFGRLGNACTDLTDDLQRALGTVQKQTTKPEFNTVPARVARHV